MTQKKRVHLVHALAIVAALLVLCVRDARSKDDEAGAIVIGRVVDEQGEALDVDDLEALELVCRVSDALRPLSWEQRIEVAPTGKVSLPEVPLGHPVLNVNLYVPRGKGYCLCRPVAIRVGEEVAALVLRRAREVHGRVELDGPGLDLGGVSVHTQWRRCADSDMGFDSSRIMDGEFFFDHVPEREELTLYLAPTRPAGARPNGSVVRVSPGSGARVKLVLSKPLVLTGRVTPWPCPLGGSYFVHLWPESGIPALAGTLPPRVAADGRFRCSGVKPVRHVVFLARVEGPAADPFDVGRAVGYGLLEPSADGSTLVCSHEVDSYQVQVIGAPGERFALRAYSLGHPVAELGEEVTIPAGGRWRGALQVSAGLKRCGVIALGADGSIAASQLKRDRPAVALRLGPPRELRGRVIRDNWDKILVMASVAGWHKAAAYVTQDGHFLIEGLPAVDMDLLILRLCPHEEGDGDWLPGSYSVQRRFERIQPGQPSLTVDLR